MGIAAAVHRGDLGLSERRKFRRDIPTLDTVLDRFFDKYAPQRISIGRLTPNTVHQYRLAANAVLRPAMGHLKVSEIRSFHVENALTGRPPVARNRELSFLSRIFSLCEKWGHRPQNSNPCFPITRSREQPRDRTLSSTEFQRLAASLDAHDERHPGPVAVLRFACLTGLRISEILAIQWTHIEFESRRLLLPTTKTGRRRHDLPATVLDLLEPLPRTSEYTFTSDIHDNGPIPYAYIRDFFAKIRRHAGLDDIRIHDIRRTYMTRAAASGINTHVLRDILGHRSAATADRYIRNVGSPVREARQQIADDIATLIGTVPEPEQTP